MLLFLAMGSLPDVNVQVAPEDCMANLLPESCHDTNTEVLTFTESVGIPGNVQRFWKLWTATALKTPICNHYQITGIVAASCCARLQFVGWRFSDWTTHFRRSQCSKKKFTVISHVAMNYCRTNSSFLTIRRHFIE